VELELNNLSFQIGKNKILEDISADVKAGEFIGLLGPNGSGKSTLLKTIYRVLKPNSGVITLNNKNLNEIPLKETAKNMAVVSQFNNFNFDFTVKQVVMMGRTPHKKMLELDNEEDYKIVYDSLKKVNMVEYINRNYSTLSGGEKQRIILARALTQQPKILILDEPTNHLDIKYQLQLLSLIKSLKLQVFTALHDLNIAAMYCDRIYILKRGKLIAKGDPKEVLTKEIINDVFEIDVNVSVNPDNDRINIQYII